MALTKKDKSARTNTQDMHPLAILFWFRSRCGKF